MTLCIIHHWPSEWPHGRPSAAVRARVPIPLQQPNLPHHETVPPHAAPSHLAPARAREHLAEPRQPALAASAMVSGTGDRTAGAVHALLHAVEAEDAKEVGLEREAIRAVRAKEARSHGVRRHVESLPTPNGIAG